ncbi:hypothetical protein FPZ24_05360 [Sphingomonas panacisoli]|uniref:TonB C-terminal domain-containing protein n=1 Tax=Sphingomonas panacisoli TaxID=1813879 RepID=A0A5B8LFG3_9SPHN|nr:hypothetical protein [Sphingomonas panacisoli]QDZ06978.1 hypothetical protein FPZ24_05360 [Sphingomonas panacisoli]
MIALFLALQAAASVVAPPTDWSALPPLRLSTTPDYPALMTQFVHDEVAAGRCAAPPAVAGKVSIKVDMVVLISPSGDTLRIVPKAINCPTVEQFAAGVVQKAARGNLAGAPPASDSWYRTGMTLSW